MPQTEAKATITIGETALGVVITMPDGISVHVQMPRPTDAERTTVDQLERQSLRHAQRVLRAAAEQLATEGDPI